MSGDFCEHVKTSVGVSLSSQLSFARPRAIIMALTLNMTQVNLMGALSYMAEGMRLDTLFRLREI